MIWPTESLVKLGVVQTGSTPSTANKTLWDGDIPFVTPAELDQNQPITQTPRTISEKGSQGVRLLREGAILVCCIGSLGKIGMAGRSLATNQQINSVEFDSNQIFPRYGFYACSTLKNKLATMAPATTVPIVSKSKFEQLKIPIPPLSEQRRIAAILDQADALRAKRREALAQLDSLTQSIFIEMFGDPATNPRKWETLPFKSQIESVRYGTGSPPPYVDHGVSFIRATNIKEGRISTKDLRKISAEDAQKLKKCRVNHGNLIVVRSGVNTGDCAVIPREFDGSCAAFNLIVDIDPDNAVFYGFLINSEYGRQVLESLTRRAAQPHLNAEQLQSLPLIAPPVKLRKVFAERVEATDALRIVHSMSLAEFDTLFASLQHRAFRGEL